MKCRNLLAVTLCAVLMTGCEAIGESVNSFIENDANIGKNAPAVMGTIGDIQQLNEEAEKAENVMKTPEELKSEAEAAAEKALSDRAESIISEMSTDEKIGQLILARMPEDAVNQMSSYSLGGYTLYANDFENRTPEEMSALISEIAEQSKVYPFFAVDEEGGKVVRVSKYTAYREEPFSSPQLLYQRGGTELLAIDGAEKAKLLKSIGINFNLAPVADVSTDKTSYIYPRTLGQGAENTAEGITVMIETANDNDLASCLKHFPGYGENTDTHKGAAHDPRELYEFYNRDFVVFEAGINADSDKTPAVMVGHTIYDMIDENVPASLSAPIHQALREKLDFDGVVITDDMGMDAIIEYSAEQSPYVLGILAGNDMLCVSDHQTAVSDIKKAYEDGTITDEMINQSVKRILIMKLQYGIIE